MKNTFLIVAVLAILLIGGFLVMKKSGPATPAPEMSQETPVLGGDNNGPGDVVVQESPAGDVMQQGTVKEFTLDAFDFGYDKKTITVNKGDTVKITLTNSGKMMHDWVVDEFAAKTKRITNGQTDTVSFVADQTGTFEYYCSVGNHRAQGMKGSLVVK